METIYNDSFQVHLILFSKIIDDYPPIEKVRKDLEELKLSLTNDSGMTYRQRDAIQGRIENYLKGEYGEQVKRIDNRSDYSKKLS